MGWIEGPGDDREEEDRLAFTRKYLYRDKRSYKSALKERISTFAKTIGLLILGGLLGGIYGYSSSGGGWVEEVGGIMGGVFTGSVIGILAAVIINLTYKPRK